MEGDEGKKKMKKKRTRLTKAGGERIYTKRRTPGRRAGTPWGKNPRNKRENKKRILVGRLPPTEGVFGGNMLLGVPPRRVERDSQVENSLRKGNHGGNRKKLKGTVFWGRGGEKKENRKSISRGKKGGGNRPGGKMKKICRKRDPGGGVP